MRLEARRQRRRHVRRTDRLVEVQHQDDPAVDRSAAAVPPDALEPHGRRREIKRVRRCSSFRPLTAVAVVSTVTSYLVENGSGRSGVKIRIVVPDHRNDPLTAGAMRTNGARTWSGILPSVTIGSENTIRISLACWRLVRSPLGPVETTCSPDCALTVEAKRQRNTPNNGKGQALHSGSRKNAAVGNHAKR